MSGFSKAVKSKQRLRLAIDGISGSGKTFTALSIASGMSKSIAVIDSEHRSSELYADRFSFDVMGLEKFQVEDYTHAIDEAAEAGYEVCIIDSTSHAWDALVERVERIANQKYGGNTFRAWGEGTPLQRTLIEKMLSYPGHLIVTCRSKTEYSVDKNDKGQTLIKKVGTAAVQRSGFEYEFTMSMTMDANHVGLVSKDRTGKFQDAFIEKPGKKFGADLIAWLNEGAIDWVQKSGELSKQAGYTEEQKKALWASSGKNAEAYCKALEAIIAKQKVEAVAEGDGDDFQLDSSPSIDEIMLDLEQYAASEATPKAARDDIAKAFAAKITDVGELTALLKKVKEACKE